MCTDANKEPRRIIILATEVNICYNICYSAHLTDRSLYKVKAHMWPACNMLNTLLAKKLTGHSDHVAQFSGRPRATAWLNSLV